MTATYCGPGVDSSGNLTISPNASDNGLSFLMSGISVTAPASGNWADLSLWCNYVSGLQPHIRLAVFRASDGRREAQGNAAVTVSGFSPTWQGHLSPSAITQYNAAVSGTAYLFGIGADANVLEAWSDPAGSSGDYRYSATDETGGWPDPAPTFTNNAVRLVMRAGISTSSGVVVPQITYMFRQRGN